ncbi:DUF3892 domain-containing protein [Pedobacter rhodius]|uniref:DUF3892 domain-containing protein n=1 Tax=Pedobacter rhodius TaxID=3004098 RepID=A0ABT4L1A3_9SPHI|nr:DUF3892 domain-containing protein [Pedobacter sp. SJ11]MCZ4224966.1 DUF3892 domain-containing protein [Pedobacter sp. SJ11]
MAKFKISGVWKDKDGVITHYAFHEIVNNGISRAIKTDKTAAIKLLTNSNNTAVTWIWDYNTCFWNDGENVEVVAGKYLRSNPDKKVTDNLAHLINYDWL